MAKHDNWRLDLILSFMMLLLVTFVCSLPSPFDCPNGCSCVEELGVTVSADCSARNMTTVPPALPASLRYLTLSRNSISTIKSDDLSNCTRLLTLDLSFNVIENVSMGHQHIDVSNRLSQKGDGMWNNQSANFADRLSASKAFNQIAYDEQSRANDFNEGSPFRELKSLQTLILHHNRLKRIDADIFTSTPTLISLDLSFNDIKRLENGAFRSLVLLEKLNLSHNALSPSSGMLSENVFDGLKNLIELKLQDNFRPGCRMSKDDCYPDKALSILRNLQRLFIDGLCSHSCVLGYGFQNLTKLALLDFQTPSDKCQIQNVSLLFFSNISTTENLTVSLKKCIIGYIHSDAFSFLPTLTNLDLSFNENLNFEGFENASMSLYNTCIRSLDITYIQRSGFQIVNFSHLKYLRNTSLEILVMRHNRIIDFEKKLPTLLPRTLKEWDISNNKLNSLRFGAYMPWLTNLEMFNMSVQNKATVTERIFSSDILMQFKGDAPTAPPVTKNHFYTTQKSLFKSIGVTKNHFYTTQKSLFKSIGVTKNHFYTTQKSLFKSIGVTKNHFHTTQKSPFKSIAVTKNHFYTTQKSPFKSKGVTKNHFYTTQKSPFKFIGVTKSHFYTTQKSPFKSIGVTKTTSISSYQWLKVISQTCRNYARDLQVSQNVTFVIWDSAIPDSKTNGSHESIAKLLNGSGIEKGPLFLPKNLRRVYGTDLKLGYSVPPLHFANNDVLEVLDLSRNLLTCFDGPLSGLPALKLLDLSSNYCRGVSTYFFQYLKNLRTLLLSRNSLGPSLAYDVGGNTFANLTQLETIELAYNNLQKISPRVFLHNTNLKNILLANNSLYQFVPALSQLSNLSYLDLSFNNVYFLSQQNMDDLDSIRKKNSNVTVNLMHNPIRCDCLTRNFVSWYQRTQVNFKDSEQYVCTYINGSKILFHQHFALDEEMYRICNGPWFLTITLILCCITLGIYTITALVFYYKHFLYFYFYLRKQQLFHQCWNPGRMRDAFVVYDSQDIGWRRHVLDVLIPNLTRTGISYHLAEVGIDEPSAGRPVWRVVEESVLRGRKTLVLLTRDVFFDDENQLAVHMAKMVQDTTHSEVLVFLGVERFNTSNLSPQLYRYLQTCHVKKYSPEDPDFWRRLSHELMSYRISNDDFLANVFQ